MLHSRQSAPSSKTLMPAKPSANVSEQAVYDEWWEEPTLLLLWWWGGTVEQ